MPHVSNIHAEKCRGKRVKKRVKAGDVFTARFPASFSTGLSGTSAASPGYGLLGATPEWRRSEAHDSLPAKSPTPSAWLSDLSRQLSISDLRCWHKGRLTTNQLPAAVPF